MQRVCSASVSGSGNTKHILKQTNRGCEYLHSQMVQACMFARGGHGNGENERERGQLF